MRLYNKKDFFNGSKELNENSNTEIINIIEGRPEKMKTKNEEVKICQTEIPPYRIQKLERKDDKSFLKTGWSNNWVMSYKLYKS